MNKIDSLIFNAETYRELIKNYTDDPYINNTIKNLIFCLHDNKYEMAMIFLERLSDWYTSNLPSIKRNDFVHNFESHSDAAIQITKYFQYLSEQIPNGNEDDELNKKHTTSQKPIKGYYIFISHSSKDKQICTAFVNLLEALGVPEDNILYSSSERFGIPADMDIFEYLRSRIVERFNVYYMLSDNYYESVYCLNEMGAAWVNQNEYSICLLPNLTHSIKGVIDRNVKGYKLSSKVNLNQLKDKITNDFNTSITENKWDEEKDKFLEVVDFLNQAPL